MQLGSKQISLARYDLLRYIGHESTLDEAGLKGQLLRPRLKTAPFFASESAGNQRPG